LIRYRKLT